MKAALILATQLFEDHPALHDPDIDILFFIEAESALTRRPFHAHKLVLILSGLRHAAVHAEEAGHRVAHLRVGEEWSFATGLRRLIREHGIDGLAWMSATDRGVDERLRRVCDDEGVATRIYPDALFLTAADDLDEWFGGHPRAKMEDFYRWQRVRTGVLMDGEKPAGGAWNFDADNRHPLPSGGVPIPALPEARHDGITREVMALVADRFADHPGDAADFWLPVTAPGAREWLASFVAERLELFGRYEDAMAADEPFLFHAVISPFLNVGLLRAEEVVRAAVAHRDAVPIASLEGFVRQVIGWREYMRGSYRAEPALIDANHFELTRPLEDWWYTGTGIPDDLPTPVRVVLERVHRWGYAHHIERLMVLGNWFLLQGYHPRAVFDWYSALFIDAYEWVMVPNVQGMSQYADGGGVATKPYVSGGAYLQKMGRWWGSDREARDSVFTSAYWAFLDRHEAKLAGNPRLNMPLAQMRRRRGD
ncbi:deoxyribodipyrimidine photolyase-related protein [Microbacterium sp. SLBN-154]|uniref:cryptochrome/photolyase family protein n=1 Tax=Microbacterium sp. SLBN-154 TaxID=2768458 RepID=UPI00114FE275|nr:cryptochrome/photolyase family protein [Microbacterium sp. SLBN-154]TQK20329.1 deoxyribodipyrimidine photolyase-related protein [Microbacterium sp. SLBN-154]